MAYSAKIICDSISEVGVRLTTMEVTFPRIILAEFNTHRMFCLAGDAELEFDLPGGAHANSEHKRVYKMRLDTFVDRWHNGSAPRLNNGGIGFNRQPVREKLQQMRIRQLDEETGLVVTSTVEDCYFSGEKPIYEVRAGKFRIAGSADHRILTDCGWKPISELSLTDAIVVRRRGKRAEDILDPVRLKKIGGRWRSVWQREAREALLREYGGCQTCGSQNKLQIHHKIPVYQAPELAFDASNIQLLCEDCHNHEHDKQGWQGGTYLYGDTFPVDSITYRGVEPTYDLSITGRFENFVANGVIVHNSRNSASSRAIPVEKRIAAVMADPFVPAAFGKNKRGMQASEDLVDKEADAARVDWLLARNAAVYHAERLSKLGVHKQLANRLLEPFLWHTVLVTATEWSNFFALRCHPDAQPEMQTIAKMMRDVYEAGKPSNAKTGEWHIPFDPGESEIVEEYGIKTHRYYTPDQRLAIAVGRCARVSTLTHDGKRDTAADMALHDKLLESRHLSPFEHVAQALPNKEFCANFRGWRQVRRGVLFESDFGLANQHAAAFRFEVKDNN